MGSEAKYAVTNNKRCGSLSQTLQLKFPSKHPNIFIFVDAIKKEQALTDVKARSLSKPAKSKKFEQRRRENSIKLCQEYKFGQKTRLEYLEAIDHMCPPADIY